MGVALRRRRRRFGKIRAGGVYEKTAGRGFMKRTVIIFILFFLAVAGSAFAAERKEVLIVSQGSDFKKDVVERICERIEGSGVGVTRKDLSFLGRTSEDEWDAIVVIHAIKVGRMKRDVRRFFDGVEDWDRVIVVTTCGSKDPVSEEYGIDSMTAASKKAQVEGAAAYAISRIKSLGIY